ncbi:uncharacterized protein LOC131667074 [Phymastichus coffea]|uniref:uncharacterized protein LOC131667074 n=1 Tax=Phymastichus coffea TaxID=108790 RepID=UPI00273BAA52|nr:uncharacterized protein LOC131667074 [Phymastichus coffea]
MSPIATYSRLVFSLNLGLRREYTWPFIIADIHSAIIDIDFLSHAGLLPDLQNMRLVNYKTSLHMHGQIIVAVEHSVAIIHRQYDESLVEIAHLMRPNGCRINISGSIVQHRIIIKGASVFNRPRPLHGNRLKEAKCAFKKLEEQTIVRPSASQWVSILNLVDKSPGNYCETGHYRKLNAVTEADRYPLTIMEDLFYDCMTTSCSQC